MEWGAIVWSSDKQIGRVGCVWCFKDEEDGGVICIDKFGDFRKEMGIDMDETIGYWNSWEEAIEWISKMLRREVRWI